MHNHVMLYLYNYNYTVFVPMISYYMLYYLVISNFV